MPVIVDATPGGANANSYLTVAEAQAYWDSRLYADAWNNSDDQAAAVVWATRTIDALCSGYTELIRNPPPPYYLTYPQWTGSPATTTQALAWPRIGMYDRNGNAIPTNVIPQDLKNAVAELAGSLSLSNRTLDSDVAVKGLTSVRAGSVALTFKENIDVLKVLPDYVLFLIVPSWLTNDQITPAYPAEFDVVQS